MYTIWYFRSCGRASWVIMGRIMVISFWKPAIALDLPQFPCYGYIWHQFSHPHFHFLHYLHIYCLIMATNARYLTNHQFHHLTLDPEFPCPPIPLDIPSHGSIGMNQMVSILVKAYQTPSMFFHCVSLSTIFRIKVPSGVNLIRLSKGLSAMESGTDLKWEAHLLESHPPAISGIGDVPAILSEPSIILGEGDSIALWYLPGVLAKPIQVWAMPLLHAECYLPSQNHIVSSLLPLHEKLQRSITNQSWSNLEQYFRQGETPLGCLEFSPARHMQGHSVRLVILVSTHEINIQHRHGSIHPLCLLGFPHQRERIGQRTFPCPLHFSQVPFLSCTLHFTQQVYRQERSWMHDQGKIALPCKMHWNIGWQCIQTYQWCPIGRHHYTRIPNLGLIGIIFLLLWANMTIASCIFRHSESSWNIGLELLSPSLEGLQKSC